MYFFSFIDVLLDGVGIIGELLVEFEKELFFILYENMFIEWFLLDVFMDLIECQMGIVYKICCVCIIEGNKGDGLQYEGLVDVF